LAQVIFAQAVAMMVIQHVGCIYLATLVQQQILIAVAHTVATFVFTAANLHIHQVLGVNNMANNTLQLLQEQFQDHSTAWAVV
jgi:hypothetical protein